MANTKQAEKDYLARAGTERWERVKPFSSPGHDDINEGARLIHDFAVALLCLEPRPGERVLDLGGGSAWASEWLRRYNIETVTVDIATDMLRIGRARLGPGAWLVTGDLERLPFATASMDKALCLNAFHHVPDGDAAAAEIHRVLRPGGRVFFSEPGRGHADAGTSVEASASFGVQEREILAGALVDQCTRAGFSEVAVKPLAYTVPWFQIDSPRWSRWQRLADRKRPVRAGLRILRALADACGIGKQTAGFEDTLGMELVRIVRGAIDSHPIVVATKG